MRFHLRMFSLADRLRRAVLSKRRAEEERTSLKEREQREVAEFCANVIAPTLEEMKREWEQLGRKVSLYQDATIFHVTVWHERIMEFDYSIEACRRKRRSRRYGFVHPEAMTYKVESRRVYSVREIRRTDRKKFAKQLAEQYRQSLLSR